MAGAFYMVLCVLITSLAGVATKLIVVDVPVYTIACLQYLVCLVLLLPKVIGGGKALLLTDQFGVHLVRGLGGWLCFLCYYLAIEHVPLVEAALLRSASPLCVPFVIVVMTGRWIPRRFWGPILVGFVGVGLILRPESEGINYWHLIGFLSAVFLAISMVFTRKLTAREPPARILFYYFLLSFLCGLPLMWLHWRPIPFSALPGLLFIGLSIYVALVFYTKAYQLARASLVSPLSYTGVVFAGIWGWLIWGHVPDLLALTGIGLVALGGLATLLLSQPSGSGSAVK